MKQVNMKHEHGCPRRMENSAYPRDVLPGLPHMGKCPTHFYGSSWMCRVCVNLEIPQNCDVFFLHVKIPKNEEQ